MSLWLMLKTMDDTKAKQQVEKKNEESLTKILLKAGLPMTIIWLGCVIMCAVGVGTFIGIIMFMMWWFAQVLK